MKWVKKSCDSSEAEELEPEHGDGSYEACIHQWPRLLHPCPPVTLHLVVLSLLIWFQWLSPCLTPLSGCCPKVTPPLMICFSLALTLPLHLSKPNNFQTLITSVREHLVTVSLLCPLPSLFFSDLLFLPLLFLSLCSLQLPPSFSSCDCCCCFFLTCNPPAPRPHFRHMWSNHSVSSSHTKPLELRPLTSFTDTLRTKTKTARRAQMSSVRLWPSHVVISLIYLLCWDYSAISNTLLNSVSWLRLREQTDLQPKSDTGDLCSFTDKHSKQICHLCLTLL